MVLRSNPQRKRLLWMFALGVAPLVFWLLFFGWPLEAMLVRGLAPSSDASEGFWGVLTRARTFRVMRFTLVMASAATALSTVFGLACAHVLYRLRWSGVRAVRALILLPFVLPAVVVGVAFRSLFASGGPLASWGWDGAWQPILLAMVFFNVSVIARSVGPVWAGLDGRMQEAASGLGASPRTVFRTVTWPALRGSVISAASVVFLFCSTAFGIVLMLGGLRYGTLDTEVYSLTVDFLDLKAAAALSVVQLLLVAVLLFIGRRFNRDGGTARARMNQTARRPQRHDALALVMTVLVVLLITVPLMTLIVRSFQGENGFGFSNYSQLSESVLGALSMSWRIAVDAAGIALVLGVAASALVTTRVSNPRVARLLAALDAAFMLPLGISAVTIGFGFMLTLNRGSLQNAPILIPFAQAIVALPMVMRVMVPVLRSLDPRPRQAAAALGASPLRAFWNADVPVLWRPLLAAAGFALTVSLGEFGATSFLAQPDSPTLPVLIYQFLAHPGPGRFGAAMAGSVILALCTGVLIAIVDRIGGALRWGDVMNETGLQLRDLAVRFGETTAVDGVSVQLAKGRILAVLGPSGCGKSTLLRTIAGLEQAASGQVMWDDADMTRTPTHKRDFALMFQDGQLFAHMSVFDNVAYGLKLRGEKREAITQRVEYLLDLVGLAGFGQRATPTLSGGQQQRVALARALAVKPRLLLLDEPLSALDRSLRERLAEDLRAILVAEGTTALFVTHDHDEALTIADDIAIMNQGRIVQQGNADDVWRQPANPWVARFLGATNNIAPNLAHKLDLTPGQWMFRPRDLIARPSRGGVQGVVTSSRRGSQAQVVTVRLDDVSGHHTAVEAFVPDDVDRLLPGATVGITAARGRGVRFD